MAVITDDGAQIMKDTTEIILVIVCSFGAVMGLIMGSVVCLWCFGKNKNGNDSDEEALARTFNTGGSFEDANMRSDGAQSFQHTGRSPAVTKKTIRFGKPESKMVTKHVQPKVTSQTAIYQQLGLQRESYKTIGMKSGLCLNTQCPSASASEESASLRKNVKNFATVLMAEPPLEHRTGPIVDGVQSYKATGSKSGLCLSTQSPSASEEEECASVWENVKSFATVLMADPPPDPETEPIVDGVDFKLGKLQFGISYDFETLTLSLRIIRATELPAKDITYTSDPYVKIALLPDKKHKLLTKVKKRNSNPHWKECFLFEGWPYNKLVEKTLYLKVIDYDRFSRDDPIGETYVPLNSIDMSQSPVFWKNLQPCKDSRGKLGELLLSLRYQPHLGRLSVIVMKAKDLKAKDINGPSGLFAKETCGSADPYVKIWLSFGQHRVQKKKTTIKNLTLNPVFNESFTFDISWEKLREASLEVVVMDFDQVGRNELIGKVTLSGRSGPMETRHWNDMVSKPKQQVAQWHLLKD